MEPLSLLLQQGIEAILYVQKTRYIMMISEQTGQTLGLQQRSVHDGCTGLGYD